MGKSTTAVSLGASLAELGHRVLVVDLDPQGNASTGLGIRHEQREVTVYDVLADEAPIEEAIVPTPIDNLFAIPSTIDLAGAEIELVSQFSRELRLKKAIEPLKHDAYDYVFLDCPPSLGLLTVNALAAAEELIVPIQCEYYALEGLGQLLRNVRLVQQNVNTGLRLTGIVMTMFDPRTKLSEQVVAEVRRYFGDRVYRTIIPRTVRLSEAPGFGQPITVYDPQLEGRQRAIEISRGRWLHASPTRRPLPNVDDVPSVTIPRPEQPPSRAPRPLVGTRARGTSREERAARLFRRAGGSASRGGLGAVRSAGGSRVRAPSGRRHRAGDPSSCTRTGEERPRRRSDREATCTTHPARGPRIRTRWRGRPAATGGRGARVGTRPARPCARSGANPRRRVQIWGADRRGHERSSDAA